MFNTIFWVFVGLIVVPVAGFGVIGFSMNF